ncbi:hypothetical protein BC833DRAFT_583538 [Globomyces pollinis-pini]|nr:hypothetical protein BC833DRAFT_583538 [Globomyces pollinis-pini]
MSEEKAKEASEATVKLESTPASNLPTYTNQQTQPSYPSMIPTFPAPVYEPIKVEPAQGIHQGINSTQPTMLPGMSIIGSTPQRSVCPACHSDMITTTKKVVGNCSFLSATGFCTFGVCCFLPACLCTILPFTLDAFKDTEHHCSNCQSLLGKKSLI